MNDVLDRERKEIVGNLAEALKKAFEFYHVSLVSDVYVNEGKVMLSAVSGEDIADYVLPMFELAEMDAGSVVCSECKYYGKNQCSTCTRKRVWMTDNYEPREARIDKVIVKDDEREWADW